MVSCKLIHCPKNAEDVKRFFEEWTPLLAEHLEAETKRTGIVHDVDVMMLLAGWEAKGIVVIMAYENDKPVGFLIAHKFRPVFMPHVVVLNVERWQGSDAATRSMFEYIKLIADNTEVDQLHAVDFDGRKVPDNVEVLDGDSYRFLRLKL